MKNTNKVAIVLLNLGAPDSNKAIAPFLINLFSDPAILPMSKIARWFLARYITFKRLPEATKSYNQIGGHSPLLANTIKQAEALDSVLNTNSSSQFKSFIAMRYWHPFTDTCALEVSKWQPNKIVLLPLYPQYSTTTTESSIKEWSKVSKLYNLNKIATHSICCWPTNEGFIASSAEKIKKSIARINPSNKNWHLLFSAHGLPYDFIEKFGDPYPYHIKYSAEAISKYLKLKKSQWSISFQSRVGNTTWLQPYTEDKIIELAKNKTPIIIYPISFVSEHSETLIELDLTYRELAYTNGAQSYTRVPTVDTDSVFINGLAKLINSSLSGDSCAYTRQCPDFSKACFRRPQFIE